MPGTSAGRVCGRLAATVLALTLGGPAFATASSGVVVFGSYLNAQTAESQAEVLAERLGVGLAVTEVLVDGTVFHRVVSEPTPEAAARQLIERAAERGQDAWFAPAPARRSAVAADVAPTVPATVDDDAAAVTEDIAIHVEAAEPSAGEREGLAPRMREPSAGEREGLAPRMREPSAGEREGPAPRMQAPTWTDRFTRIDLTGSLRAETRLFYRAIGHAGQRSRPSGLVAMPQLYVEDRTGWSFTLSPFYRFDSDDPERTHADLHEAYALFYGPLGDGQWETRLGVDRAFWGVVESNNLVDIINQIDLVEHPDEKSKLGQPMAYFAYAGNWGTMELFGLPYHRQRTFPGYAGRLRLPWLVDDGMVSYESDQEERHVDAAARYSHSVGFLDFGISAFQGTSREPFLAPRIRADGQLALAPHYEQIRQAGLDGQATFDTWLLKLEAIYRSGMSNRLGEKEDYASFVLGGEYTFHGLLETAADITVLAEWCYDERGLRATTKFDNDVFLATRLAFNDVQGTELLVSALLGTDHDSRVLTAELTGRLTDRWSLRLEAVALLELDPWDVLYETREDSFVELGVTYSF